MEVPGEGIKAQGARECELEVPDYTIRSSTRLGKLRMFKHSRFKGEQRMEKRSKAGDKKQKGPRARCLKSKSPRCEL